MISKIIYVSNPSAKCWHSVSKPNLQATKAQLGPPYEWVRNRANSLQPRRYLVVAVGSSGILKAKQKLGVTFNFDKQDVIDFTKFSKMTMCRASEANS